MSLTNSTRELVVQVTASGDTDKRELAEEARLLYAEVSDSNVESVRLPAAVESAAATKGDAVAWTELVISFSGGLPAIVQLLRHWVGRSRRKCSLVIELDGDKLQLSHATAEVQQQLIDAWLDRHARDRR